MASARWLAITLVLVGCQDERKTKPAPPPRPAVALDKTAPIERIAWPAPGPELHRAYDCTVIPAMKQYFAGTRVENCGVLDIDATDPQKQAAHDCVDAAVKGGHPFLFAQEVRGEDSAVVRAFLARVEGSSYVAYSASYDSNPCGGGCPERGHTYIQRCAKAPRVESGCVEAAVCLDCDESDTVEDCTHGTETAFSRADAERARHALFVAKPTALADAFGPIVLGAPSSEWKSTAGVAAEKAIMAGGIVGFSDEARMPLGARIDSIGLSFAGSCNHVRDEVIQAWGPPVAPNRWLDLSAHRAAALTMWGCVLTVSSYADPEQWAAKDLTAPFPLVPTGMKVKEWIAKVGGELNDEGEPRWRAEGLGPTGIPVIEMGATVKGGRVVGWETGEGKSDEGSIKRLRDQLTKLYGAPKVEDGWIYRWRGTPKVTLTASGDGSFELTAD